MGKSQIWSSMKTGKFMSLEVREYAITYGVKGLLLSKNWDVIAYNPPGSQGTFTIPNPNKDGGYRGQTGSESPDVIAIKRDVVLVVECKAKFNKNDANKMKRLSEDSKKMEILNILIRRVCAANEIEISGNLKYIYALAYQGEIHQEKELGFFKIGVSEDFNINNIPAESSYERFFQTSISPASTWEDEILELFKN
jgi:hypothetical protein